MSTTTIFLKNHIRHGRSKYRNVGLPSERIITNPICNVLKDPCGGCYRVGVEGVTGWPAVDIEDPPDPKKVVYTGYYVLPAMPEASTPTLFGPIEHLVNSPWCYVQCYKYVSLLNPKDLSQSVPNCVLEMLL